MYNSISVQNLVLNLRLSTFGKTCVVMYINFLKPKAKQKWSAVYSCFKRILHYFFKFKWYMAAVNYTQTP